MLVIDACITVKWVVKEDGTLEALALRQKAKLIAPELLVAECANILWKKIQRGEFLKEEALLCARLFQGPKSSSCPRGLYLKPRLERRSRSSIPLLSACALPSRSRKMSICFSRRMPFCGCLQQVDNAGYAAERFHWSKP